MIRRPDVDPNAVTVVLSRTAGDERRAARNLVLRAVGRLVGADPGTLRVTHEPGGRPGVAGADAAVSVSHTRGLVAVAVSRRGPVGVDVELPGTVRATALARRYFPAAEADWVDGLPPDGRARGFLSLWTAKEALGKALGTGLRGYGLRRPVPTDLLSPSTLLRALPGTALSLCLPPAPAGTVLAVAGAGDTPAGTPVRVFESTVDGRWTSTVDD